LEPSADTTLASWPELSLSAAQRAPHGSETYSQYLDSVKKERWFVVTIFIFAGADFEVVATRSLICVNDLRRFT